MTVHISETFTKRIGWRDWDFVIVELDQDLGETPEIDAVTFGRGYPSRRAARAAAEDKLRSQR